MDFVKNAFGGNKADKDHNGRPDNAVVAEEEKKGGFNFGDAINGALGGGKKSEANEGGLSVYERVSTTVKRVLTFVQRHRLS